MDKLAINDYDALLFNKNAENRSLFIEAFIPYIYKYAKLLYENNIELFSAYYSLEDLISDDGKGFDVSESDRSRGTDGKHLGLVGMKERADFIGAKLEIDSHPNEGTQISIIKLKDVKNSQQLVRWYCLQIILNLIIFYVGESLG